MIINEIGSDGEPKNPAKASTKATNFCGFLVRERVPISIQRWKSSRADDVSAAQKEMLWTEIKAKYTIKEEHEQLVRKWLFYFSVSRHRKTGHAPDFNKFPKYRDHWQQFLAYKTSEEGQAN